MSEAIEVPADWLSVRLLSERHPTFSQHSIRWMLFHSRTNGLEQHVRRLGRKIVISERGFLEWINGHRGATQ